jgi:ectoine hydroxylase-related dioxygenase (phytanoyl-CoA dioxygenase family)
VHRLSRRQGEAMTPLERFARDGYVLVRDALDLPTVRELRRTFLPVFEMTDARVLHDALLAFKRVRDAFEAPKVQYTLATLLGSPYVVPPYSSIAYNGFGVFHTDTTGAEMAGQTFHRSAHFRLVTAALYLQDNTEAWGGGITLVPGSHRQADPYPTLTRKKHATRTTVQGSRWRTLLKRLSRDRLYDWSAPFASAEGAIDVPSRAGDLVVWDLRIIHRATPKREPPPDAKLALFFNAGADNAITRGPYLDYVRGIPENVFLREGRSRPVSTSGTYTIL